MPIKGCGTDLIDVICHVLIPFGQEDGGYYFSTHSVYGLSYSEVNKI